MKEGVHPTGKHHQGDMAKGKGKAKAPVKESQPALGSAPAKASGKKRKADTADQDDLERELEEAVFGTAGGVGSVWDIGGPSMVLDELDGNDSEGETGLERLQDENLFFVDVPEASTSKAIEEDGGSDSDGSMRMPSRFKKTEARNLRQSVWVDPADEHLTVSLANTKRLRKLRTSEDDDVVGGIDYEGRLRQQYEKMNPLPAWAVDARRRVLRRKARKDVIGANEGSDSDEDRMSEDDSADDEELRDLFATAGRIKKHKGSRALQAGEIDIDRVRDANQVASASGSEITSLGFHPKAQVLYTTSVDRRLRLFQIDGTDNPLLQALHVPELPITSAAFHPSGSSVLLTGPRPFYISFDVETGVPFRSPRGLLTSGLGGSDTDANGGSLERFAFSPDGAILAVAGRRGFIHLVDWAAGASNATQVISALKINGAVKSLTWARDGRELVALGEGSEVYVWDVGTRKCVNRWRDDGGFGAAVLAADRGGKYQAVGSTTGIVNLYDSSSPLPAMGAERKATKTVDNITTAVSSMTFNHDAQLLALASKTTRDHFKLVHVPTGSVFSNWPTQSTPLHHVTAVDFSKRSEYMAIGNARGKVLLYSLSHFARR